MNHRIFIQKKISFDQKSNELNNSLKADFQQLKNTKITLIYDIFNLSNKELDFALVNGLTNPVTDTVFRNYTPNEQSFACEYLPGQFDQKADSAKQLLQLLKINQPTITTAWLYEFEGNLSSEDLKKIQQQIINPIESRIKNLDILAFEKSSEPEPIKILSGFNNYTKVELQNFYNNFGFSLAFDDLELIQSYFIKQNREPTETELKVLDTYWSDHCRHTTFETILESIQIDDPLIQNTYNYYTQLREELTIKKPIRLMDLATIKGKELIQKKIITNIDISDEINACSIVIPVDEDGKEEDWLLQFKNETHNHPTEIEPFGGASTCIGGAIRDPLSGRAYVYQAMRISGASNPLEDRKETLAHKLPQRDICQKSAHGFSSYGNQIGVATTFVKEFYHPGYQAKRMEVGFVMGAVRKNWVRREQPQAGDVIIVLGGKTGRDGVGGASGSSKIHTEHSIEKMSAEVQKGNAPEERKIQRFFRKKEALQYIKKCNDFGAGGVAVAIGEISEGVRINLDTLPTKYDGLNGTELAISESQERMAVVVARKDSEHFIQLANKENLEATVIAEVTKEKRMEMSWKGEPIVQLNRSFINTNGMAKYATVQVPKIEFSQTPFHTNKLTNELFIAQLQNLSFTSQKGLQEEFDYNIGRGTVLAPYGGYYQLTPEDISVQKLPTDGYTETASMASIGFSPALFDWSCFHGGYYAVIESVAKLVAGGANYKDIRLSFQEYFEKLTQNPLKWGKVFAALLGTIEAQKLLQIAAIGGKDSMSGTYENLHVPPTLISFAVCSSKVKNIRSSTLQKTTSQLYLLHTPLTADFLLEENIFKENLSFIHKNNHHILSCKSIQEGGLAYAITLMSLGNQIGVNINTTIKLNTPYFGSFIIETTQELAHKNCFLLGTTTPNSQIKINDSIKLDLQTVTEKWLHPLSTVYNLDTSIYTHRLPTQEYHNPTYIPSLKKKESSEVKVLIPIFFGTNSEYDSQKAFINAGAQVTLLPIRNVYSNWLEDSINTFIENIATHHILFIPGGFSAADEPDGSGKFIASFLRNERISTVIHEFIDQKKLILGICNGFQALIQSGLLPYGKICTLTSQSPILYYNTTQRHNSTMVRIKVTEDHSPFLKGMKNKTYWIPVSHGEGNCIVSKEMLKEWSINKQIATQYVDTTNTPTEQAPFNPNGSTQGIEGITSKDGLIYGRMGHPERVENNTYINIPEVFEMDIFSNAVAYANNLD